MITLTEVESAKASRFFCEACALRFAQEVVSSDINVTEGDISSEKARVEFLENKLASLYANKDSIKKMLEASEIALQLILKEAVLRLDPTADPSIYSAKIVDGSIVALDRK